jgi:hypothetical protein
MSGPKAPTVPVVDAAAKLTQALEPVVGESEKRIINAFTVELQELRLEVSALRAQLATIEALIAAQKKAPARVTKATSPAETPDSGAADSKSPVPVPESFPTTNLIWFRNNFKSSEEFRKKWISPELQELMDKEPTIQSKAKPEQKLLAMCTYCWSHIKLNDKDRKDKIDAEYKAAKDAHAAAKTAPQLTAEPRTPTEESEDKE